MANPLIATTAPQMNMLQLTNPAAAMQLQQQQALAAQLMQQGEEPMAGGINRTAAGGVAIPYTAGEGLGKLGSMIAGAYLAKNANAQSADLQQQALASALAKPDPIKMPDGSTYQPPQPTMNDILQKSMLGEPYNFKAQSEAFGKNLENTPEFKNASNPITSRYMNDKLGYINPQGNYQPYPNAAPQPQTPQPQTAFNSDAGNKLLSVFDPENAAKGTGQADNIQAAFNGDKLLTPVENAANQIGIENVGRGSQEKPKAPLASDGKPIITVDNWIAPDPTGMPKIPTENTKQGVSIAENMGQEALKGSNSLSTMQSSLAKQQNNLNNLIDVFKVTKGNTLMSQDPGIANKLVSLGIIKNPKDIATLANIQTALPTASQEIISQLKNINTNGDDKVSRMYQVEYQNLEKTGINPNMQPQALFNVISQAKGLVDHNLDMANGWEKIGGLGNRLAGGYTMTPDVYTNKFMQDHKIADYTKKVQSDVGSFAGMENTNTANGSQTIAINPKTGEKLILQGGQWQKMQ